MKSVSYIDTFGKENSMPQSLWDQLPEDKGGLKLIEPKEVKEEKPKNSKPEEVEKKSQDEKPEGVAYPTDSAPSEEWTVPQLEAYSKDNNIKLGRAKKEAAILEKIREAGH